MDYFIMCQDDRIFNTPQLLLPKHLRPDSMTRERIESIHKAEIIYVKENRCNEYPDYIETPIKLISDKIMRIMGKYQQDIVFKPAILIETKNNRQEGYRLLDVPGIECSAAVSPRDALGNVKEFVLDEEKVGCRRIFLATDYRNHLLVRLDVAESILRRGTYGIWFEKVESYVRPLIRTPSVKSDGVESGKTSMAIEDGEHGRALLHS